MPSSHLILCRPLLLLPQSLPASESSNESTLHMRWPKYWSFSFSISPSKEHPELISFRMDWLDLLALTLVQSLSCVQLFATPWIAARQATLSITNSREFTQTHVRVGDAIQPSHPVSSPSPPAPSPSKHQSLFQWVNSSHEVAKVLKFQLQHHSFQRNPRADLLQNGLIGSPCTPRDSQESSPTPQFKSINSLALSLLHSPTLTSIHDHRKNHSLD